jgi:hypothetical protein
VLDEKKKERERERKEAMLVDKEASKQASKQKMSSGDMLKSTSLFFFFCPHFSSFFSLPSLLLAGKDSVRNLDPHNKKSSTANQKLAPNHNGRKDKTRPGKKGRAMPLSLLFSFLLPLLLPLPLP